MKMRSRGVLVSAMADAPVAGAAHGSVRDGQRSLQ